MTIQIYTSLNLVVAAVAARDTPRCGDTLFQTHRWVALAIKLLINQ
jgi:hypothetical protein